MEFDSLSIGQRPPPVGRNGGFAMAMALERGCNDRGCVNDTRIAATIDGARYVFLVTRLQSPPQPALVALRRGGAGTWRVML